MTDFSKWTDERINEAIFKSKGWVKLPYPAYPKWQRPTPEYTFSHFGAIPDYTHDWRLAGELLEEMKCDVYFYKDHETDEELLALEKRVEWQPGLKRAICEAWLAWKGAE